MAVEKQVAIIHLGTNNRLRDVPVERVKEFEEVFLGELERQHPEVLEAFRNKKFEKSDLATLDQLAEQLVPQFAA